MIFNLKKVLILMLSLVGIITLHGMASRAKYEFSIPILTNSEYTNQKQSGKSIAVVFNAKWCPSCMAQHKALDSILPNYSSKIPIFAYDWDEIEKFEGPKVKQRTTIAIIKDDKIVDELIGETRKEAIATFLDKHVTK